MALKEIVQESDRSVDKFSNTTFGTMKKAVVPEGHSDYVSAVAEQLKDFCKFSSTSNKSGPRGGRIADRHSYARIETEAGAHIDIEISQSYEQPGAYLKSATAKVRYDPGINGSDVNDIRKALCQSGLELID
jgi:hypothetical protein